MPQNYLTLDQQTIVANLKEFLRGQSNIQDYDYEGSNIATVLNLLAYNTSLQNFYINMLSKEMFLDTAQIRNSIISHCKELNYVPRSSRGATAYINVQIVPNDAPTSINIDKYTKFNSTIGGQSYTFTTEDDIVVQPQTIGTTTAYIASNVAVYEGAVIKEYYEVDTANNFVCDLSNEKADTRFINVRVQEVSGSANVVTWSKADTIFGLGGNSAVYFLEPAKDDKYSITFGDNVFGKHPDVGNIVEVTYRVVNEESGNNGKTFTAGQSIDGYSNVIVTTASNSTGGAPIEGLEEIRRTAPRAFQVQERAVTAADYQILVQREFPSVENVLAFGGEDLTPPKYGRVVIAVDVADADGVSDSLKSSIKSYLSKRTPVSIDVDVIDPNFLYVDVVMNVAYNVSATTLSSNSIRAKAIAALTSYAESNINAFNGVWRNSKAVAAVDNADDSIISTQLLNRPYLILTVGTPQSYELEFHNQIKPDSLLTNGTKVALYEPAVQSTLFTYGDSNVAYLIDNGDGKLYIVRSDNEDTFTILNNDAGTINYSTGIVNIKQLTITEYIGNTVKLYSRTTDRDIRTNKQTILQLNSSDIVVNITQERI